MKKLVVFMAAVLVAPQAMAGSEEAPFPTGTYEGVSKRLNTQKAEPETHKLTYTNSGSELRIFVETSVIGMARTIPYPPILLGEEAKIYAPEKFFVQLGTYGKAKMSAMVQGNLTTDEQKAAIEKLNPLNMLQTFEQKDLDFECWNVDADEAKEVHCDMFVWTRPIPGMDVATDVAPMIPGRVAKPASSQWIISHHEYHFKDFKDGHFQTLEKWGNIFYTREDSTRTPQRNWVRFASSKADMKRVAK